jgi:intermediate filament protein if
MQGYEDEYSKTGSSSYSSYKSQITPRSTNVQRRSGGPSGIMTRMYQSYSSSGGGGFNAGGMGGGISGLASIAGLGNFSGIPLRPNRGSSALVAVNETREREKRELCQLNDKFAQYVEKVRFLEAQNRKLQLELEALQNKAGQGSSKIKEMYEVEMNEAKKLIDDTTRDRAAAEVKARDAEKEAGKFENKKRFFIYLFII